uniref:Uncharacterized protein n=1 Tax=Polytomella parva TaxID=51329 RepID=A0A7S0V5S4_9CHLO|mmetsp:Transcript_31227/g.56686  ORF Transcript_31227/g.56686 Transcript_31227/m.56686 type:complete len:544 (+) Transcript_31227:77-1708(+)
MSNPVSVFIVLGLGCFFGEAVRGITGFGSAIVTLLVWVSAKTIGIYGGTLQQTVTCEALSCVAVSIPLLFLTQAHKTADWKLTFSIVIFTTLGSPIGAIMLTHLNQRIVEFVMACTLVLVIGIQVQALTYIKAWIRRNFKTTNKDNSEIINSDTTPILPDTHHASQSTVVIATGVESSSSVSSLVIAHQQPSSTNFPHRQASDQDNEYALENRPLLLDLVSNHPPFSSSHHSTSDPMISSRQRISKPSSALGSIVKAVQLTSRSSTGGDRKTEWDEKISVEVTNGEERSNPFGVSNSQISNGRSINSNSNCSNNDRDTDDSTVDIEDNHGLNIKDHKNSSESNSNSNNDDSICSSISGNNISSTIRTIVDEECERGSYGEQNRLSNEHMSYIGRIQQWLRRPAVRHMLRYLMYGSLAGTTAGVMNGMTGIGGPPIIYLYDRLQIPKDIVRGTSAVNNVLQFRVIFYLFMGLLKKSDIHLYALCMTGSLLGTVIGNKVAGYMNQQQFRRSLIALMCVCCILLFASAAGVGSEKSTPVEGDSLRR